MPNIELVDTHCHIHDSELTKKYEQTSDELISEAKNEAVRTLICVGTDVRSSIEAVSFVQGRKNCFASVALHPHESANRTIAQLTEELNVLEKLVAENTNNQIVAIGECGLDYYYHESKKVREKQIKLLEIHLRLAKKYNLPLIFHVREAPKQDKSATGHAFDDFFDVLDKYPNVRGVVHSFSADTKELEGVISRGLFVGLNGIMTFTKQTSQLEAAKMVPLDRLVLETDAPFLTPAPFRGKMCKPKHVCVTAQFLSELRGESLEELSRKTTINAKQLFGIK